MLRVVSTQFDKPFQNSMKDAVDLHEGDLEWESEQGYDQNSTQTRYQYQTGSDVSIRSTRQRLVQIGKAMDILRKELEELTQELLDSGNLG